MSAPATDVAVAAARGDQPARSSRPLFWSAPSFSRRCTIRYSDVGSTPSSEPTSRTVIPGRALTIESNCSRRPFWRPRPGLRALVAAPAERVVAAAPRVLRARRVVRRAGAELSAPSFGATPSRWATCSSSRYSSTSGRSSCMRWATRSSSPFSSSMTDTLPPGFALSSDVAQTHTLYRQFRCICGMPRRSEHKWSISPVRSPGVPPMSLCNDTVCARQASRTQRDGRVLLGAARALAGARAATLELHEHQRCGDRGPLRALHPLVALLLEAAGAVHDVGEHLRQLVPGLLVKGQRRATDMDVLAVEAAGLCRALEVPRDITQRGVGQRSSQGGGKLCPVVVADERRLQCLVVVLDRAAPGLRAHQLDHVEVGQEAHVVADVAERLVELLGKLARTGHLLVEQREHSHPEWVREGLHDPLIDGRLLCRHAGLAARCGGPNGVGRSRTLTINAAEAMQFLHPALGAWRVATNLSASRQATRAPSAASSAPLAAWSARSIPSSSTSRCVTARTRSGPTGSMPTSSRSSAAQNAGASGTEKITMFVSTVAGSSPTPGSSARPSASRRARAWSSARRSTWWSSAYSPAAATIPDWRSAPPSICFHRHASAISSADPARHAPTGAPRPLVKSSHALSKPPAHDAASTPLATTAFMRRAPSRCVRRPCIRATPSTSSTCSSGHTRPPPMFVGCST